jgi:hypothetical protein
MTPTEKKHYQQMHAALQRIKAYQTPDRLRRNSRGEWGCDADEAIEMAYENVLAEAAIGLRGVRGIKSDAPILPSHRKLLDEAKQ